MDYISLFIDANLFLILPLILFGLAYYFINQISTDNIINSCGWKTYAIIGAIGVPIHELSHLIAHIIFGHKITKVCLYRPRKGKIDGTLGYVTYRYNILSIYQQIGTFIAGIAPMIGGSFLILFLMKLLLPITLSNMDFSITNSSFSGIINLLFDNLKNIFKMNDGFLRLIIFLVISFSISLNINISNADLKCSVKGLIIFEILLIILSIVSRLLSLNLLIYIIRTSIILLLILTIGLIFSLISFGISFIVRIFKA